MQKLTTNRKSEQGFTLVELAIVMIIIGLLITGILKGQEMIANAQITSSISQIKGLDASVSTFRDKYRSLPGDMTTPTTRLANCAAAPCSTAGDGDGRIELGANLAGAPTLAQEGVVAFAHLGSADLISGIASSGGALAFGEALPSANIGGGYWLGYSPGGVDGGVANGTLRPGHYLVLNGVIAAPGGTNGVLNPAQALQIDNKLDDGNPIAGAVQAGGTTCQLGTTYDSADNTGLCTIVVRVQG